MARIYHPKKDSLIISPPPLDPEVNDFYYSHGGIVEETRHLGNYDQTAIRERKRLERLLNRITNSRDKKKNTLYDDMSTLLTSVSLDLTPDESTSVLMFVSDVGRIKSLRGLDDKTPDLVSFFADRETARLVASQGKYASGIPSVGSLVCPVVMKVRPSARSQSLRHMVSLARHNPSSPVVYGLFTNREVFQLFSLGLDHQAEWNQVKWKDEDSIDKLYTCLKIILDNAARQVPAIVPSIISEISVSGENKIDLYGATINQTSFTLLPLFRGRAYGRKPFVAVAVANSSEKGKPNVIRILKYSWHQNTHQDRESQILMKLCGVPGVVQIDKDISQDWIDVDQWSGRVRNLLALKTVGYPLCSCTTVLGFLEAMYDLLEVLRYLVQERGVLHRDISWGNILIRPKHSPDVNIDFPSQATNEPIPHHYRFISDVFQEKERRVRVALADFDLASDLNNNPEAELKEAIGTSMFMASDVLCATEGWVFLGPRAELLRAAVMDSALKYSDDSEMVAWDTFYSNLTKIEPIHRYNESRFFKHGAVHDAESVFYLCLLFFNRMQRSSTSDDLPSVEEEIQWGDTFKALASRSIHCSLSSSVIRELLRRTGFDPFSVDLLGSINTYLSVPWYNVKLTGHKEQYEFHLHDFMQRLLLKKIRELRQNGADPIAVSDKPRRVRVAWPFGRVHSGSSGGSTSTVDVDKHEKNQSVLRALPTLMGTSEDVHSTTCDSQPPDHHLPFKSSHLDPLKYKERERLWTTSDSPI